MHDWIQRRLRASRWPAILAVPYFMLFSLPVFYLGAATAVYMADQPYFSLATMLPLIPFLWLQCLVRPLEILASSEFGARTANLNLTTTIIMSLLYVGPFLSVAGPSVYSAITRRLPHGSLVALSLLPISLVSGYLNGTHNPAGLL